MTKAWVSLICLLMPFCFFLFFYLVWGMSIHKLIGNWWAYGALYSVARRCFEVSAFGSVDISVLVMWGLGIWCVYIGGGVHRCCSTLVPMRRSVVSKWGNGENMLDCWFGCIWDQFSGGGMVSMARLLKQCWVTCFVQRTAFGSMAMSRRCAYPSPSHWNVNIGPREPQKLSLTWGGSKLCEW